MCTHKEHKFPQPNRKQGNTASPPLQDGRALPFSETPGPWRFLALSHTRVLELSRVV